MNGEYTAAAIVKKSMGVNACSIEAGGESRGLAVKKLPSPFPNKKGLRKARKPLI